MNKIILSKFPIHIEKTKNKIAQNKYIKINNQNIYNGYLSRFTRAIVVKNIHNWIISKISKELLPKIENPVILTIDIYTVINHGDISMRNGHILWKPRLNEYIPDWDEDNLRMIWEKCIKDSISILKIWPDDNVYYCRGIKSMVYFIDNLEDRKIEIGFEILNNE